MHVHVQGHELTDGTVRMGGCGDCEALGVCGLNMVSAMLSGSVAGVEETLLFNLSRFVALNTPYGSFVCNHLLDSVG